LQPEAHRDQHRAAGFFPDARWHADYGLARRLEDVLSLALINRAAGLLSDPFVQENFAFNGHILTGSKEIRPRWKRCTGATDQQLGEALGEVYVQKYFRRRRKRERWSWSTICWQRCATICKPCRG